MNSPWNFSVHHENMNVWKEGWSDERIGNMWVEGFILSEWERVHSEACPPLETWTDEWKTETEGGGMDGWMDAYVHEWIYQVLSVLFSEVWYL